MMSRTGYGPFLTPSWEYFGVRFLSNFKSFPGLKFVALSLLLFCSSSLKSQQSLTTIDGWNAYVHLPDDYASTTLNYPVIIFIPGIGEIGTNPARLLSYGPSHFISLGHPMQFMVNGVLEKPIVISLQPLSAWPGPATLNRKLDSIAKRWRIDIDRISVTGLSMGGWAWENMVALNTTYAGRIASMVIMSAPEPDNGISNMRYFAQTSGKWWGFEGTQDARRMNEIRDTMNFYAPGSARYTQYVGGHCCWNTWYNPSWVENGENIYQWLLKFKKGTVTNQAPVASAGADINLIAPQSQTILVGRNSNDPDGWITQFLWSKLSGGAVTIQSPSVDTTVISGLVPGVYSFSLLVTDNKGNTDLDTVLVNVAPPVPVNKPPVANAGIDGIVSFPENTFTLTGSGNDPDGTISSYTWVMLSGPAIPVLVDFNKAIAQARDLIPGTYVFRLTVTDEKGATAFDDVQVKVENKQKEGIHPNPIYDHFVLTLLIPDDSVKELQLFLYDVSGKLIWKNLVYPPQKGWWSVRINCPGVLAKQGIYFFKIGSIGNSLKANTFPIMKAGKF